MSTPGTIVWLTGRPAAGKSTIATALVAALEARGERVQWLDSDVLRATTLAQLSYGAQDRDAFYARLGELAVEAAGRGETVVVSATAPRQAYRDAVRARVARFIEVLVTAPTELLEQRDPKGLYAKARAGAISTLPGVGTSYEVPAHPEVTLATNELDVAHCVECILARL